MIWRVPFHSANLNKYLCYCQDPAREEETVMCSSRFCVIHHAFHKSCTPSKPFRNWICIYWKNKLLINEEKWLLKERRKTLHVTIIIFYMFYENVTGKKELFNISTLLLRSSARIFGNTFKLLLNNLYPCINHNWFYKQLEVILKIPLMVMLGPSLNNLWAVIDLILPLLGVGENRKKIDLWTDFSQQSAIGIDGAIVK